MAWGPAGRVLESQAGVGMSTERIVLRAFGGDEGVAEELLARGFAPGLMETREGREIAQPMLGLRTAAAIPTLASLRQALTQKGSLPARLRRYLVQLEMTPVCSRLHAVAHLQLLILDAVMDRADHLCQAITAQGGGEGGMVKPGRAARGNPACWSGSARTPARRRSRASGRIGAASSADGPTGRCSAAAASRPTAVAVREGGGAAARACGANGGGATRGDT